MVMDMEMAIEGMIEMTVDQIIEETIADKTSGNQKYRNRSPSQDYMTGLGQDIEAILEITARNQVLQQRSK